MNNPLAQQAGSAFLWKGVELGATKVIFLARTLIVARLLLPEDFGLMAISLIAVDFLMGVTNLGMVPALVQRQDADERCYNAAWTVNLVRALTISACVFIAAPLVATLFAEPRAVPLIRVVAARPVLEALASIKIAELTRGLRFRSLTLVRLCDAIATTVVSISLAPSIGVWGLVAGVIAGQTAYLIASYVMAPHRPRLSFDTEAARSLIRFGRWIFLSGVIAMAATSALQAVISRQLGATELGLYFLAAKLAFIPTEIAAGVFGAVAFPLFARLQTDISGAARAYRALLIGLLALVLPACVLLFALAPSLVHEALGPRWVGTAPLIRVLVLANIVGLFGETVVPILKGRGQPHKITVLEGIQSLLLVGLVWELAGRYGVVGAAAAWLPAVLVSQVMSAVYLRRIFPRPFRLGVPLAVIGSASGAGAAVALAVDSLIAGFAGFFLGGILGAITVGALLWVLDHRLTLGLTTDLSRVFPQLSILRGTSRATS